MPEEPLGNTFFEYHVTTSTAYSEASPLETEVDLTLGIIHQVELIPWGFAIDILKCRIERFHSPVFPANLGAYVSFNGKPIIGRVHYEIDKRPTTLRILSWNDSTLYSHTFTVRFWLMPKELVAPEAKGIRDLVSTLRKLFIKGD